FVRRFEPILYFHQAERFFPVDPKPYIEASALWRTRRPTRTKDDWGEEPPGVFPKKPLVPNGGLPAANTSPDELDTRRRLGDLLSPVLPGPRGAARGLPGLRRRVTVRRLRGGVDLRRRARGGRHGDDARHADAHRPDPAQRRDPHRER